MVEEEKEKEKDVTEDSALLEQELKTLQNSEQSSDSDTPVEPPLKSGNQDKDSDVTMEEYSKLNDKEKDEYGI